MFSRFTCVTFASALAFALAASGCELVDSSQQNLDELGPDAGLDGEFDRDDCKIEDDDIGVEGVQIVLGDFSVTFSDWVLKDGATDEYIGFTIDAADGEVSYTVKAGLDLFHDDVATWLHPYGTGGPEVHAISYVDVCEDGVPPGNDGDDGDGGDDGDDDDDGGGDDDGDDDDDDDDDDPIIIE